MTAVMVPENAEVEGMTFNVLNNLKEATGPLPWAVCAIVQSDTGQSLNYGCAWLRASTLYRARRFVASVCRGAPTARANQIRAKAAQQLGCPPR
jgi:hypothetical protein